MGYSEAKFSFRIEMSDYIMVLGIFLSGGDTSKYAHRYKIRDSVPMVLGIFLSGGDTSKYAHRYKIRDSVPSVPHKSFDRS